MLEQARASESWVRCRGWCRECVLVVGVDVIVLFGGCFAGPALARTVHARCIGEAAFRAPYPARKPLNQEATRFIKSSLRSPQAPHFSW